VPSAAGFGLPMSVPHKKVKPTKIEIVLERRFVGVKNQASREREGGGARTPLPLLWFGGRGEGVQYPPPPCFFWVTIKPARTRTNSSPLRRYQRNRLYRQAEANAAPLGHGPDSRGGKGGEGEGAGGT